MNYKIFYKMLIILIFIFFLNMNNVSAANTTFSIDEVANTSSSVQNYVEHNHKMPKNVTISGTTVTMPQFLKLETTAIYNIKNNITTDITLVNYNISTTPSETLKTTGNLTKSSYLTLTNNVITYMNSNGKAPNNQTTTLGNIRYENLIYIFSELLNSYQMARILPNFIVTEPWSIISNKNTIFINMGQIKETSDTVMLYIEANHKLPDHVTIEKSTINMPQFLNLELNYLIRGNGNLYQSIILKKYGKAPNPSETITGGELEKINYLNLANEIITFMEANGRAPNVKTTIRGNIRYESFIYMYSVILNSASIKLGLPSYVKLIPWTTVTNSSTVFFTMNQINAAATIVKFYLETNHSLPSNVSIFNKKITMPQFLKLEITSLKYIYAGLYQSIIFKNYNSASSPSENISTGKINYENYMNVAENIRAYMDSNNKAPNYQSTNLGNMRFESLVYMYAQLLNYYNINNALPQNITLNPWKVITNTKTVTFNTGQILNGAETVVSYIESKHALPSNMKISGTTVNTSQFLKLALTTLANIKGNLCGQIVLESYVAPENTSETITGGIIKRIEYLNLAKDVENFMYANDRAPNYQTSKLGNIKYQSLVYMYGQILYSYKINNKLPAFITVRPWLIVSNTNTKFYSIDEIETAARIVKDYVEVNHTLPISVNISGKSINMPNFLKLITTGVYNLNGNLTTKIVLQNYNTASNLSETNSGGNISCNEYLKLANNIISYMDANNKAPNYQTISLGNIHFNSLVFMFSQILTDYKIKEDLTQNITINKWLIVSKKNNPFFTVDQIKTAAKTVQSFMESNHTLPNTVKISETNVTIPQFLKLAATAILNINKSLLTSHILENYTAPSNPSEIIKDKNLSKKEYLSLINDVITFMYTNGKAPNYITSTDNKIQYESLVYMFSGLLNSNSITNTLPESIKIMPWNFISNSNTSFISLEDVKTAAEFVKSYVDTNYQLPANVTISGQQVTMPQYLKISAQSVINIENYSHTSVILEPVRNPSNPTENISSGIILNNEFVDMAHNIISYIDNNGIIPNNISDTSLGGSIRYETLIYMFSKILISYSATEQAPDNVSIIPWLALSNPVGTFNFRTQEIFNDLQTAIDDADTINGDTIWLGNSNYTESVDINKKITIRPLTDVDVTINTSDSQAIFTINTDGSGTIIRDLIIKGSANAGIYINNSTDNLIEGNKITENNYGIILCNSSENVISGNEISNNYYGVIITNGNENEISNNSITENENGISIRNSNDNHIYSNKIFKNHIMGIHLINSSTDIHYNIIIENYECGLYNEGNSITDAKNNWWGTNNPTISPQMLSDIYVIGGTLTYDPWLIFTIKSSTDRSDRNADNYNYIITADLTHNNQGNDTSPSGNIPDDIPIYFETNLGTINNSALTRKGKAEIKLIGTSTGTANISTTLDNQTLYHQVIITNVNLLGVLNTRTHKGFSTIQDAINDVDTINGDTITLAEGIYTENVIINKKLIIQPVTGANIIVKSNNLDQSVFVIDNEGSGTTIQNLKIISSADSYGIALSHAYDLKINNNIILNSTKGIYLYLSSNNSINNNIIRDNYYGIAVYKSINNTISNNNLDNNEIGIYLYHSNNNKLTKCTVKESWFGLNLYHSNNNSITNNSIETNWVGIYLNHTNNNNITENNIKNNGSGITYCNSISTILSENKFIDNWLTDKSVIDSGEMVMATTIYTCGPAALATILKNLGIYTDEAEIAELASTDKTGTSLYGLKRAAESKGVSAVAAYLSTSQLKTNYIVVLSINGRNHIEVVQNKTENNITLFDPNLGIIEMSLDKFKELYTGIALVINDSLPPETVILNDNEMRNIKAMWHYETIKHSYYVPGYCYLTYKWIDTSFWVLYPYWVYVPGYYLWGFIPIPGHYELRIGWHRLSCGFWIPQIHYVPGRYITYYTRTKVLDGNDIPKIQISYEWKGFGVVKDRLNYGGIKIIAGLFGAGSSWSIVPGLVSIWDGLNEYGGNLDKIGSKGWINPK